MLAYKAAYKAPVVASVMQQCDGLIAGVKLWTKIKRPCFYSIFIIAIVSQEESP